MLKFGASKSRVKGGGPPDPLLSKFGLLTWHSRLVFATDRGHEEPRS